MIRCPRQPFPVYCQESSRTRYLKLTTPTSEVILGVQRLGKLASKTPAAAVMLTDLLASALVDIESHIRTIDQKKKGGVPSSRRTVQEPDPRDHAIVGLPSVKSNARSNKRQRVTYENASRKSHNAQPDRKRRV